MLEDTNIRGSKNGSKSQLNIWKVEALGKKKAHTYINGEVTWRVEIERTKKRWFAAVIHQKLRCTVEMQLINFINTLLLSLDG